MTEKKLFELLERMRYEPTRAIDARDRILEAFRGKAPATEGAGGCANVPRMNLAVALSFLGEVANEPGTLLESMNAVLNRWAGLADIATGSMVGSKDSE